MTAPADRPRIPRDFVWRQSTVADYLRCPRRVLLEHVQGGRQDHRLSGYATVVGTALHAVAALALEHAQDAQELSPEDAVARGDEAFDEALVAEMEAGAETDPESVVAASERMQALARHVARLSTDPRVRAVDWQGIEESFDFELSDGRAFAGTIDAWGVAKRYFELSPGGVGVAAGQKVVVDWKSGEAPVDYPSRDLSVQLAVYAGSVDDDPNSVVPAYGLLRDLAPPVRVKDDEGNVPAKLKELNPRWLELLGVSAEEGAKLVKKPKDPLTGTAAPKWLERPNPAYAEATSRPRGPVFHGARIDWPTVSQTVADVIDAARAGLFPAAGAVTGECRRCPFRTRCAHQGEETTT